MHGMRITAPHSSLSHFIPLTKSSMTRLFTLERFDPNDGQDIPPYLMPLHEAFRVLPLTVLGILLLVASLGVLGIVQCVMCCGRR